MEYAVSGLFACLLFWVLKIAPLGVAFGGFSTETPWFLLGALLIGALAVKSGLATRIAQALIARVRPTYPGLLLAVLLTSLALTFVAPSGIARLTILGSLCLGLMQTLEIKAGGNMARGLFLAATYSASLFDKTIIAGAPALTGRQLIMTFGHVKVSYGGWLVAFLPATALTLAAIWLLTLMLYPPEPGADGLLALREQAKVKRPWTWTQGKAAALLSVVLGLWLTDAIHGISPAAISLGAGLLAMTPLLNLLDADDLRALNFPAFLYLGAALSMALVLSSSGLTATAAGHLAPIMAHLAGNRLLTAGGLYWLGCAYHLFLASEVSMLSTSTPALMKLALSRGDSPLFSGMVWVFSSGGKLFAYQSAVLLVGASFKQFGARDLLKLGLALMVVEFVVLMAVVALYWPLIGLR